MPPRPLDLLDLPTLYRYRAEVVSLDSSRLLTRGNPLGAAGFMSYFNLARHVYTAVLQEDGVSILGGVIQSNRDSFAHLVYVAPASKLDHPGLPEVIEHLCAEAGKWGAFHVIAEVEEDSKVFPALRKAGFMVYARQRIWDVSHVVLSENPRGWLRIKSIDLPDLQSLHNQIVPPLLHPVEQVPRKATGMICAENSRCYVNISYGSQGIFIMPLIHPDVDDVENKLIGLLNELPDRRARPVYMCVRSYQAWLEPVLEEMGGTASLQQAVMVKHLARPIKEEQLVRSTQPAGVSIQPSRVSRD